MATCERRNVSVYTDVVSWSEWSGVFNIIKIYNFDFYIN